MNVNETAMPILVAVDGSESALDAVRWAAAQAVRQHRGLRIVHAYEDPPLSYGLPYRASYLPPDGLHKAIRATAAEVVAKAVATAGEAQPGLVCEARTVQGPTVSVLRAAGRDAELMVLGSRGLGGFSGLLVGSVAVAMAAHGGCPVVVVRGDHPVTAPDTTAPVVVGVDGSPVSELAIEAAFHEASTRGCPLVAVLAWSDVTLPVGPYSTYYPAIDWEPMAEEAQRQLGERLAGWQEKYPDVMVGRVAVPDRPVHALLEAARDAQLLVVGCRGRGGFAGLTLGSVSQALIHHAPCPVLIARREQ